jgi:hypothetical protein
VRAEDRGLERWNGHLYWVSRHNPIEVAKRRFTLKKGKEGDDEGNGNGDETSCSSEGDSDARDSNEEEMNERGSGSRHAVSCCGKVRARVANHSPL